MIGVILAAGRGTRLRSLTASRSKAMMPVLGKPIIERVMETLRSSEIERFIVVANPDDEEMEDYFASKSRYRDRVHLVTQPSALGMADALACAAPDIDGDFMLSACDNLIDDREISTMIDVWNGEGSLDGLMAILPVGPQDISRSGIVELEGDRVIRVIEKPDQKDAPTNLASLPIYIFSTVLLKYLRSVSHSQRGEYELQDAIQALIDDGAGVGSYHVRHRMDLTTPGDLLAINFRYLIQDSVGTTAVGSGTELVSPVHIEPHARVGENCVIGPNVYLESGSRVCDLVNIRDSVVLRGGEVPEGATINREVVSI